MGARVPGYKISTRPSPSAVVECSLLGLGFKKVCTNGICCSLTKARTGQPGVGCVQTNARTGQPGD